jgi:hypothetical protein
MDGPYVPCAQGVHSVAAVEAAYRPRGHDRHEACPAVGLYEPAAQGRHDDEPSAGCAVPAGHDRHSPGLISVEMETPDELACAASAAKAVALEYLPGAHLRSRADAVAAVKGSTREAQGSGRRGGGEPHHPYR